SVAATRSTGGRHPGAERRQRRSTVDAILGRPAAHRPPRTDPRAQANPVAPPMPYSVLRLIAAVGLMTIGSGAMYIVVVVLPMVQEEFGADRAGASLPYTLTMLGFGFGGILMGKLADRFGVFWPVVIGVLGLSSGYWIAAQAESLLMFAIAHGLLLGLAGSSATFAPLVADISLWFERRRGIAVAIVASGNYIAGAIWPPILQHLSATYGWRATYSGFARHPGLAPPTRAHRNLAGERDGCGPRGSRRCRRGVPSTRAFAARVARHLEWQPADPVAGRGRGLLRGDVDAAGPHRRLLRRPR